MKVWQLLKIHESIDLNKLRYTDYLTLLDFSDEQVNIIINNLDKKTILPLIEFFSMLNNGKYDFSHFERLGIVDIKEIMIDKILNASDLAEAIIILNWFKYKIDKFETKEEWQTFMDNLSEEISLSNLSYAIDTFKTSRIEAIEKVMKNAKSLRMIYLCDVNKKNRLSENNMLDLLDLVIMGYDVKLSSKLIKKIVNKCSTQGEMHEGVLSYLKNPVIFHKDLPKTFLCSDLDNFSHVIEQLKKIDNEQLLNKYLLFDFICENRELFDNYINSIVYGESNELKESMTLLLDNQERVESLILELPIIKNKLELVSQEDGKCILMVRLLEVLPYDIWLKISKDFDISKLEYIYNNSKTFLDIIKFIGVDVVMDNINLLSLSNLIKIFETVKLKVFSNSNRVRSELNIMFKLKEQNFIDSTYKKYLLAEEKSKLLQKNMTSDLKEIDIDRIKTLGYFLDVGYDVELFLNDYQSDDEISSKTLVKNM